MILLSILIPVLGGCILLFTKEWKNRKGMCSFVLAFLILTGAITGSILLLPVEKTEITVFYLTKSFPILFSADGIARIFSTMTNIVFILAGIFSFSYMEKEEHEKSYYGFYLLLLGVLNGLDFAGNLITFYALYEMMTLCSLPLVLHNRTAEAKMAGLKYLFFSLTGAYLALFGFYFLSKYSETLSFTAGGVLNQNIVTENETILLIASFCMLLGFGVKAGLFPMHSWLSAAHPVAPAPASGVLSGIIVKAGVLGSIRCIYQLFGIDFIRGTWVQETYLILILITILLGSCMAFREKNLKKRLAYSTISQISYILLGLAMMTSDSFNGSLLHAIAHAFMKCGLFLIAGAIIHITKKTKVDELTGIGKEMPVMMICYTLLSLSMIGIPPMAGFISKWYLGLGCIKSGMPVYSILAPAILLISALLTAGYLLPISIKGFLPGNDYQGGEKRKVSLFMQVPVILFTVLVFIIGLYPEPVMSFINTVTQQFFRIFVG